MGYMTYFLAHAPGGAGGGEGHCLSRKKFPEMWKVIDHSRKLAACKGVLMTEPLEEIKAGDLIAKVNCQENSKDLGHSMIWIARQIPTKPGGTE